MVARRILVVEDDPDGQEMVKTILLHHGFEVDTADNGEQASQLLFNEGIEYQVVLVDLALPGMDGWELLRDIQDDPRTRNLPCIAVTAFHNSKLREAALNAGFTAYFPKPLDKAALSRELEKLFS